MGRKTLLSVLTLVIMLTGHQPDARAATLNAASCSPTDVQAAVNAAASGDTVVLPVCTYTNWNTTVTITKQITLKGQGTGQTIIQRARVFAEYEDNEMFLVQTVTGFVAQDFALDGTQDTDPSTWGDMAIVLSNCVDFRIHHMLLSDFAIGIQVRGDPMVQRGVIDHNTINDTALPSYYGYGVSVVGNGTFPTLELGTSQNIFVEDNVFNRPKSAIALTNGGRYVFRYNTITDIVPNAGAIDVHGKVASWPRGSRQYEIYNNTLTLTVDRWDGIGVTGGDGVVFNNVMSTLYTHGIHINNPTCTTPYPQQDQIRALYLWNNTMSNGSNATFFNLCTTLLQQDRDYFFSARPGYTPYTYPHPLAQSPQSLAAPTNLRVVTP